jgi:hypothetical protein
MTNLKKTNQISPICCATFPHLGWDGKTIVKDKFCYPKSVLNMELAPEYLPLGQVNPYPLAWCSANALAVASVTLLAVISHF